MLQRGICSLADLEREIGSFSNVRYHLRRPCFIGIYQEVLSRVSGSVDPLLEAILAPFAIHNGAFKRTGKARFSGFDERVIPLLHSIPPVEGRYVVHDMAVSDGRTACDFFAVLSSTFGERIDFYATDLCLKVFVLQLAGARTRVVVDERDKVLQIILPPLVLSAKLSRRQRLFYPANRLLWLLLSRTTAKKMIKLASRGDASMRREEILLICPEAKNALRQYPNFHIETQDAMAIATRRYSAVRAMNLFNLTYFSQPVIERALRRAHESLEEGGAFITGSNEDPGSTVDGGVYRKENGRFSEVYRSGSGSPIDSLIRNYGM
jgi:hypothetical protein